MWKNRFVNINVSSDFRAFFILLILAVILFAPFFINGKVFLAADNLYAYYPWKYYAPQNFHPHNPLITDPVNFYAEIYNKQLKEGNLSRWSPSVLAGVPGLVGATGSYFPVKMILHKLFSTSVALTLFLFIHVLFMGLFMYYYLSEIDAGWRGALFGAIAYMFNGCVMVWLEFELWVTVSAYLPLLLVFMERFLGGGRFRYAFAAGIVYGFMLLNSSFQLTVYVSVFMLFYIIFIIMRAYGRNEGRREIASILICFAITGLIGILIGAVEILPFIEMASNSSRMNRTFDFHQFFNTLARVPFRYFVTLIFPDFFGSPLLYVNLIPRVPTQEYMNYNELTLYMGIPTVFAFTACMIARKNIFSRYYLFMTLLIIALITGTYAYYPFFKLVPGMDKMNPTRLIFLFVFAFSVVSGLGVKGLEDMTPKRRKLFLGASLLILMVILAISLISNWPETTRFFNRELFEKLTPPQASDLIAKVHVFRGMSSKIIYMPLLLSVASCCLFVAVAADEHKKNVGAAFILILTLLNYDLISFGKNYNTTVRPEIIYSKKPSIEFLLKQPGPFRVVQDADNGLYVNTLIPFGLEEIGGYMSVYPDRTNRLMSYIRYGDQTFIKGKKFDRWVMFGSRSTDFSTRFFDLMNVRYVLTAPTSTIPYKKYKLVFKKDLAIYENMQVMPRAYIVHNYTVMRDLSQELKYMGSKAFDMRRQVVLEEEPSPKFASGAHASFYPPKTTIDLYTPDEIIMSADLSTNGWLVLSDTYCLGWIAEVDGKETAIHRANGNFRAVELQKGKHRVCFKYNPISFRAGLSITIIGVILAAIGVSISWRLKPV